MPHFFLPCWKGGTPPLSAHWSLVRNSSWSLTKKAPLLNNKLQNWQGKGILQHLEKLGPKDILWRGETDLRKKKKCNWFSEHQGPKQEKALPEHIVMLLGRFKVLLKASPCPSLGMFPIKCICLLSFFLFSPFSQRGDPWAYKQIGKSNPCICGCKSSSSKVRAPDFTSPLCGVKAIAESTYPPCWALP